MREGRAAPLDGLVREGAAAGLMELGRREAKGQIPSLSHGVEGGCGGGLTCHSGKVCAERWLQLAMRARNVVGLSTDTWQQGFWRDVKRGRREHGWAGTGGCHEAS